MRSIGVALASGVVACTAAQLPADAPGIRFARPEVATEYSHRTEHVEVPFELNTHGVNATALVLDLLHGAQASGASFVSDIAIAVHFVHDGVPVECVSKLSLVSRKPRAAAAQPTPSAGSDTDADAGAEYSTTVEPWRPEQVSAWVDDRVLVCRKVAVKTTVPRYESRHDVALGQYYAPGQLPDEQDVWMEYKDECHLETRHRFVERYAHFVATHIAPLEVARLQQEFVDPDDHVVERPPECHQLQAGEHPAQRVIGNVHYLGGIGRTSRPADVLAH